MIEQLPTNAVQNLEQFALENISEAVLLLDMHSQIHYANKAASKFLGYTKEELLAMSICDIDLNASYNEMKSYYEKSTTVKNSVFETDYKTKDGKTVIVEVKTNSFTYNNGHYIMAFVKDVSEQKKAQKLLQEAQTKFSSLVSTLPDLVWLKDVNGFYLVCNSVFEEYYGKSECDIIGKTDYDLMSKELADACKFSDIQTLRTNNVNISQETFVNPKDGSDGLLEIRKVAVLDNNQKIVGILGVGRDITNTYRLQNELGTKEEEFKTMVENSSDSVARFDLECRRTYVNPTFERLFGRSIEDVIGKNPSETTPVVDGVAFEKLLRKVLQTGKQLTTQISYNDAKGQEGVGHVSIIPEFNKDGKIKSVLCIGRNINELKQFQRHLEKTRAKLSAVISAIPDLLWVKDKNGVFSMCNLAFENFFGISSDATVGKTDYDFFTKKEADFFRKKDNEAMLAGEMCINEEEIVYKNNKQSAIFETRKIPIYDGSELIGVLGIARDISERKRMEEQLIANEKRLKKAQKIAKVGSWELECQELKLRYSDEVYRIFGLPSSEFEPSYDYFLDIVHPKERAYVDMKYHFAIKEKRPCDITYRILLKDGTIKHIHMLGEIVYDNKQNPIKAIGTIQDITEQKTIKEKIEYMAKHDALTGLPNRNVAKSISKREIELAKRDNSKVVFLFLDLDGFKTINDLMGHSMGDEVLKIISKRIKNTIRESDTISREGGDEFLIILPNIKDTKEIVTIIEKLLYKFEKSFDVNGHSISTSASLGVSIYPDHGDSFDILLQNADAAMYEAKEKGKNTYSFYTQQMNQNIAQHFKIYNNLKNAVVQNEFVLYYQPQIDLSNNCISGVEALIRWKHPTLGMIPPLDFIPVAESSGLIVQIGEWVILQACKQAALWLKQGIDITVAVNVSAVQFKRGNFEKLVKQALSSSQLDPRLLELELTESILINDIENTLEILQTLKSLGVGLSIDDFGTGYSSLAYLKRFAVDKLKIDQSFVRDIIQNNEDATIVKTIIQMAKNLNLKTIAEGVENKEVLDIVHSLGCDEVQGYHFAKPMEAIEFETYFTKFKNSK